MTRTPAQQAASFALAAVMTLGMLSGVDAFAKIEARIGAANVVVVQAAPHAAVKG
jgi:hypothetical protein